MFDDYPDVLKPTEVMEILDIGKNAVYKLLKTGELKSFRIGRNHKIAKSTLIQYVELRAGQK